MVRVPWSQNVSVIQWNSHTIPDQYYNSPVVVEISCIKEALIFFIWFIRNTIYSDVTYNFRPFADYIKSDVTFSWSEKLGQGQSHHLKRKTSIIKGGEMGYKLLASHVEMNFRSPLHLILSLKRDQLIECWLYLGDSFIQLIARYFN